MPASSSSVFSPVMRATQFTQIPYRPINSIQNNCSNTLCYTYNHSNIYQPHSGYGRVGTTAAGYLGSRKRL
jgi:hypothetical protein